MEAGSLHSTSEPRFAKAGPGPRTLNTPLETTRKEEGVACTARLAGRYSQQRPVAVRLHPLISAKLINREDRDLLTEGGNTQTISEIPDN